MTPSLGNFVTSLFAGASIAIIIGGVLVFISQNDRVTRA
uniref:Photosystem II reaction center protein X n=1 Tax=Climaconeis cf. scalaris TaxID=2846828 RepID=A0A8F8SP52_9STRA|nr:X 4.1 kDa protein of photosystem II [Climaconeis cf. scalaris]QYB19286.1 X 4.1 kDa protein of photosystem II [Climaconeis cf. scalaris]